MTTESLHIARLGSTGLDGDMPTEVLQIREQAHRFASNVMRPLAASLDRMSAADVVRKGSPIYDFFAEVRKIGLVDMAALAQEAPQMQAMILPVLLEELGWGDCGLGMLSMARDFTKFAALATGSQEVIQRVDDGFGCFLATQPDRGSDAIDHLCLNSFPGARLPIGNLTVKLNGSDYIVNGQSSAWVSGAPIATCGIAYAACDSDGGFYNEKGHLNYIGLLVPFDEPGVSKGPPLEKLGQRPLPQGAVFFDNVRVPKDFVVAQLDQAHRELEVALTFAKTIVATAFVGVGRAAYDHALGYVHERRQGGVELIKHQGVQARLFGMWRNLEASRALTRRAVSYHFGPHGPHGLGGITAKIHSTESALQISIEAVRLFGAYGLTHEYPIEKLLRDCMAALIEDGENNILGLNAANYLSQTFRNAGGTA
jgi:acyl-CoA dehydrogenase